jgi:hypothetical protein
VRGRRAGGSSREVGLRSDLCTCAPTILGYFSIYNSLDILLNRYIRIYMPLPTDAVYIAIKKGVLVRPKNCEWCGSEKRIQGHHEDNRKLLEVMWLCQLCHAARHGMRRAICGSRSTFVYRTLT